MRQTRSITLPVHHLILAMTMSSPACCFFRWSKAYPKTNTIKCRTAILQTRDDRSWSPGSPRDVFALSWLPFVLSRPLSCRSLRIVFSLVCTISSLRLDLPDDFPPAVGSHEMRSRMRVSLCTCVCQARLLLPDRRGGDACVRVWVLQ